MYLGTINTKLLDVIQRYHAIAWTLGLSFMVYPFSVALSNLLFAPAIVMGLMHGTEPWIKLFRRQEFIFIAFFVLFLMLKALLLGHFVEDISYYKKYVILLFIPFVVLCIPNKQVFYHLFLASCLLMVVHSASKLYTFYEAYHYFPFNTGWTTNYVLSIERPYFGFSLLMACLILLDRMKRQWSWVALTLLVIFVTALLLISIRASLFTLLLCAMVYLFGYSKTSSKLKITVTAALLVGFSAYVFLNKNMSERLYITDNLHTSYDKFKTNEPRFEIYGCIKDIVNENQFSTIFGFESYHDVYDRLNSCYTSKINNFEKKKYFINTQFNSHNQLLDAYLIGGIVAFSLLISFFFFSFVSQIEQPLYMCFMISVLVLMLVENMFFRQLGCMLFAVFTSISYRDEKKG